MELIETLHRTIKLAMDEGRVGSYEEALTLFNSFKLRIIVKPGFSADPATEATVLTLLNAAPRTFLGGVELIGPLQEQCTRAWFVGETLEDVAARFGVTTTVDDSVEMPTIHVGEGISQNIPFWLGVTLHSAGFSLSPDESNISCKTNFIGAGVAAAGAALNEAFHHAYRKSPLAGQREIRWGFPHPLNRDRINNLWLIGLGHVGQAVLWTLALEDKDHLPISIRLTDFDTVSSSSLSTCLLVDSDDIGKAKVDVVAKKLEFLGIHVQRDYERLNLTDKNSVQQPTEDLAIVAVDNISLRRELDRLQVKRVLEAGIGDGAVGFTRIQLHAFPGVRKARDIWVGEDPKSTNVVDISQPAYQALLAQSGDRCGTTLVAGRSVATPFVGAFAGALLTGTVKIDPNTDTHAWSYDVNSL